MNNFDEKRAYSVCITGHRTLEKGFDEQRAEKVLKDLVERNFCTFYVGMAIGFDMLCFRILEKIRLTNKIKIIACIPCLSQPDKFNERQREEYFRMVESADEKVVLSEVYTPSCMQKRNEYMVDRSGVVVAYLTRNFGGTANTVKYAQKKGISIINI